MEDSSSNDSFEKPDNSSIIKYSNDLVKRSIEDIVRIHSDLNILLKKHRILIVSDKDIGDLMIKSLKSLDFEINRIESYGRLDVIFFELSRLHYEMIILANTITASHVLPIIPEIKKRFPKIKILVISGDTRDEYLKELWDLKIDGFLPMPFMISSFVELVTKQFSIVKTTSLDKYYLIAARKNTPEIVLKEEGIIKISGNSISEHATIFYEPIINWINKYITNPSDLTVVDIFINAINGASKKNLLLLLQKISYVQLKHKKFVINWHYKTDDEDIHELGKEFSASLDVAFNYIQMN